MEGTGEVVAATGSRRGRIAVVASLALATVVAAWLVAPAFSAGHIANLDAPRHLLRSIVMAKQFLPSGHVDGWSPWWFLGAQLFLFQSYGYFFLIGATAILLEPVATLETVFKCWFAVPILLLPLATAHLARRLGATPRAAVAAAFASLAFSSPLGYGVQGVFGVGLLLQGAGLLGFAIAWPEILDALLDRRRAPWRAALAAAALVVCHFITGSYILAAAGLVAAGLALRDRDLHPLLRYGLLVTLVMLLAAHTLFPTLEHRDLAGMAVGWGSDRDRFDRFIRGRLFGARELSLVALASAALLLLRGPRAMKVTAIVFFGTAILGAANPQAWEPRAIGKLLDLLVRPRALPYAALMQAVFAGVALDLAARGVERLPLARRAAVSGQAGNVLVFALLLGWAAPEIRDQRHFVRTTGMLEPRDHRIYTKLADWLRENVETPAIVEVPRRLLPERVVGARSVISMLNVDAGVYTLHGDQAELSKGARRSTKADVDRLDRKLAHNLSLLRNAGVSYVILSDPAVRRRVATSTELEPVFEYEEKKPAHARKEKTVGKPREPLGFTVYRLRQGGVWLHGNGVAVRAMDATPERIEWTLAPRRGDEERLAIAAVNWHPNWKATVDGASAVTRPTNAHHVSIELPADAQRVRLEFVRSSREKAWNALSLVTLLLVVVACWRDRRRVPDRIRRDA